MEDVLVEVGVVCEVVITTHAGHARFLFERIFWVSLIPSKRLDAHIVCREIVSSCKIGNYGGVVTVSGQKDGSHYVTVPCEYSIQMCEHKTHQYKHLLKHTSSVTKYGNILQVQLYSRRWRIARSAQRPQ